MDSSRWCISEIFLICQFSCGQENRIGHNAISSFFNNPTSHSFYKFIRVFVEFYVSNSIGFIEEIIQEIEPI
ncbi:MAG TPA: hypothetical protein DHW29_07020 [Acinetobacter ursingii]|uniref:Uncharacterized protein n=1 Tax=Acinetobacter ursingii TaxID=108980 RepID=A0A3D2SKG9_9GAMM|nr:hypothetical protein [Acinetobacter ursingii]